MQTTGASSLWGGSSHLGGLDSNWGLGTPSYSSGANMNLLGYGNNSLSNNQGHMQSGASSVIGDSLKSNPLLGSIRGSGSIGGGWGAPGSIPPSQSTNRIPTSSSGIMQGSMPVSGAQPNGPQNNQQSSTIAASQSPGPNGISVSSSQGNNAFGSGNNSGFQKNTAGITSSGLAANAATSITFSASNGSNAQGSDNLESSGWGVPSSSENSRIAGTTSWGNPSGSGDWDQQSTAMSQSQSQIPPSSSSQNPNSSSAVTSLANPSDQRPSSWAQAAGKGLNLQPSNPGAGASGNTPSPEEMQKQEMIRRNIESHDGWGKKPIRQDTTWNIETSPKVQRKFSTAAVVPDQQKGANNMWNNNNGTAIWEANKDTMSAWNNNGPVARAPGQPPSNWPGNPQQKMPDAGSQWGAAAPGQAPGANKAMSAWGTPSASQQASNPNWGGSTETGSWGGNFGGPTQAPNTGSGISTWGDTDSPQGWGDNNPRSSGNGDSTYWGDQGKGPVQQPNWTAPGSGMPNAQAVGQNRGGKMGSGWGDPVGPPDPKIDDGTSLWAANSQQQVGFEARAAGWGDTGNQGQWNPAVGKPKPQMPPNTAQFGGVDELNWNTPKEDIWSEESMGGWDDADMGVWNYSAQQANSSWNSATGWNRDKRNSIKDNAMKFPGGNQPPQMRSRLLQQLMDLGFKRDEAQHALINNNMNLQNAVAELYNRRGAIGTRKDNDMDMYPMDGNKPRMSGLLPETGAQDDISDTQSDSNSFVPNINPMQNTPFNNAQSKIPNQFPYNNGPSLNQSSLNPNNPSINALQQKLMQKFQSQQPPPPTPQSVNSMPPSQGMGRGGLPVGGAGSSVHQQMAQQQILQQLRMAVQAGLISPQLLNQQLPAHVLVMLQQLLQQQQSLQQLINTQQMLQQPKVSLNPMVQRQQLEQTASKINTIKQQILILQKNIAQAQSSLLNKTSQSQPQPGPDKQDAGAHLPSDLSNLSISTTQPQSRLNQWKRSTPDKESPDNTTTGDETRPTSTTSDSESDSNSLNKTVGSKPIQQSSSTPNLRRYDELGIGSLAGDTTWSATPTSSSSQQNWPSTNSPPTSSANETEDGKESQSSSSTATSSSSVLDSIPAIPEFVPGKPWQGLNKNVEDDPHITPGSFSRSLSVNTVKDDYLLTLTKSSPTNETTMWPTKPNSSTPNLPNKPWSSGESLATSSFAGDVWGMPKPSMSRPPPGIPQQKAGGLGGFNRQHSWAAGQSRVDGSWDRGNMGGATALILKNLTPQIDGSTLRTLCMQHGPLQCFYLNLAHGQALVKYNTKEETMKAQKSLNTCLLGNTTIMAEFVSDSDAVRYIEQQSVNQWSQMGGNRQGVPGEIGGGMSSWGGSQAPGGGMNAGSGGMWSHMGGGSSSGGGALWENLEDNSAHNLLGNMLGETM